MVFKERVYSVLVASAAQKFNAALSALLPETDYYPVRYVTSIAGARQALVERSFDLVLINAPVGDDMGTRFAIDVCREENTVALLLVREDIYLQIYEEVAEQGVFTLQKPVTTQALEQALRWMIAARERLRKLEKKAVSFEERMDEIRLVNRAKWLLIENLSMTESAAHRCIEKQAMDRCVAKAEIAKEIIRTYA